MPSSPAQSRGSQRLFPNDHRGVVWRVFKKVPRHSRRQADAAVRRAKLRDIAGVHAIAASESHKVGHAGAIKMSAFRLCVFAYIDVGFYHVAPVVHVVAKLTRDMIFVLFDYTITTRWCIETSLSG